MKMDKKGATVIRTTKFEESNFGVRDSADLVHILSILRDKMYSNKVLAVMREYSTNAADAHIEAGKPELPISVSLPNRSEPYFKVRDWGPGLSEEEVRNVYAMYGASTKRSSNDYNGQLGLGSKSAFAYSDSFQITSFWNGTKYAYKAYIDESGLGSVAKLHEAPTDEGNGVEISVPVANKDFSAFHQTALSLYKWFSVIPHIVNGSVKIEPPSFRLAGDKWGINKHQNYNSTVRAVMGNVCYPVSGESIRAVAPRDEYAKVASMFNAGITLYFDIGDLSIAASREGLEYDKKTCNNIICNLIDVKNHVGSELQKEVDACKNIIEAKRFFGESISGSIGLYKRVFNFQKIIWQGHEITNDSFWIPEGARNAEGFRATKIHPDWTKSTGVAQDKLFGWSGVTPNLTFRLDSDTAIFINDVTSLWVRRCKRIFDETAYKRILVLDFPDDGGAALKAFKEGTLLEDKHFQYLSKWEPAKLDPSAKKHYDRIKDKVFTLNTIYSKTSLKKHSEAWDPAEVDLKEDEGFFIPLSRFCSDDNRFTSLTPITINRFIKNLNKLDSNITYDNVYGIRTRDVKAKKLPNKNIRSLYDHALTVTKKAIRDPEFISWKAVGELDTSVNQLASLYKKIADTSSVAYKLCKKLDERKNFSTARLEVFAATNNLIATLNMYSEARELIESALKELASLQNEFKASYPLIEDMYTSSYNFNWNHVVDYINGINAIKGDKK